MRKTIIIQRLWKNKLMNTIRGKAPLTIRTLIFVLLTVSSMFVTVGAFAQSGTITIKAKKMTVSEVLKLIEAQSDYDFFYNNAHVDLNREVYVSATNSDVFAVLDKVFNGTNIKYKLVDKKIILTTENVESSDSKQTKQVKGRVVDVAGEPVIGATIKELGTSNGTITDFNGNFVLKVGGASTLEVSYIGYKSQQVKPVAGQDLQLILKEDTEMLDEVVVVGYGTMKKSDLTGAVAAVKGDQLAARKTTQLSTALQGAIAGVTVTRDNNAPGAAAGSIKVRGVTTISDTSPLVIVDGVPGSINDVAPNDVESISVLKDAASASIYGSRAAAGVIVITTKRAKEKDLSISYNFEYGLEIPTQQPEYVGVKRFLEMTNELRYNDNPSGGWNQAYSEDDVNNWETNHLTDPDKYPITDWTGLILKKSAPRQTHTVNVSGGSKNVKSNASFVYDKVDGLYGDRYYERFMIRSNNDFNVSSI